MNFSAILLFAMIFIVGTGILVLTSVSLLPVFGHASPVTYSPEPNEIIDSSKSVPDQVTIAFTENPEPRASNIKIMNSKNERIDNNDLTASDSDKSLSVTLTHLKSSQAFTPSIGLYCLRTTAILQKAHIFFQLKTTVVKPNNHQNKMYQICYLVILQILRPLTM